MDQREHCSDGAESEDSIIRDIDVGVRLPGGQLLGWLLVRLFGLLARLLSLAFQVE